MKKKIICLALCAAVIGGFAVSAGAKQDFVLNGLESEYYIMLNSDYANTGDDASRLKKLTKEKKEILCKSPEGLYEFCDCEEVFICVDTEKNRNAKFEIRN